MAHPASLSNPWRPFLILASLSLLVFGLWWAQTVFIPLALAILLTFILTPAVSFFQRWGLKRVLAVTLVVLLAFSLLGGLAYFLTREVQDLTDTMARNSDKISRKIAELRGSTPSVVTNVLEVLDRIGREIGSAQTPSADSEETPPNHQTSKGESEKPQPVRVVNYPPPAPSSSLSWLPVVARPLLELIASAGLVLMLVVFMLMRWEDLRNRLIRLIGHGRLTVTTRALDEAAQRISRYLTMQLAINVGLGLVLGVGLALLGVRYAFLWGSLTAVLRFIPYIGSWLSALLPLTISFTFAPDWFQPIAVLVLYATLELFTANVIEPLLFSHSTGISSIALLVAAAFWTFLWGPIGLVLSAPLTVCLAVAGRYVPHLEFLDILLGDEQVLPPRIRYYQRLLARDQDEATDVVEDYLTEHSYETVYDDLLLPALIYARRDQDHIGLPAEDVQFIYRVTREILEEVVAPQQEISLIAANGVSANGDRGGVLVLGCPARDEADELALQLFAQLMHCRRCRTEVLSSEMLTAEVVARAQEEGPALICIGSLPAGGLAQARYLCKRLRAQFPDVKIVVGRWGQAENVEKTQDRLRASGADLVATSLLESREQVASLLESVTVAQAV
jgi:predicted PurR-regulated permease PerM